MSTDLSEAERENAETIERALTDGTGLRLLLDDAGDSSGSDDDDESGGGYTVGVIDCDRAVRGSGFLDCFDADGTLTKAINTRFIVKYEPIGGATVEVMVNE